MADKRNELTAIREWTARRAATSTTVTLSTCPSLLRTLDVWRELCFRMAEQSLDLQQTILLFFSSGSVTFCFR